MQILFLFASSVNQGNLYNQPDGIYRSAGGVVIARSWNGNPYVLEQHEGGIDRYTGNVINKWKTQGGGVEFRDHIGPEIEWFKRAACREVFEETQGVVRIQHDDLIWLYGHYNPTSNPSHHDVGRELRCYAAILNPGSYDRIIPKINDGSISGRVEDKGTVIDQHRFIPLNVYIQAIHPRNRALNNWLNRQTSVELYDALKDIWDQWDDLLLDREDAKREEKRERALESRERGW